ncbi:sperm-associated antigen 17 isoform X2 [Nelusetta ayraudi]|uniref:sperm-associated antigen 17 isoform X2 n=1 Tax=Nelusetta ayraudi TaxID=303726 RepID=UPI003F7218EC
MKESWPVCVSFVVGRSLKEDSLTQDLGLAVQLPLRKRFSMLSLEGIHAKIHELVNPKAKKPKEVTPQYELLESAKVLLDAGEEIPCDLLVNILKSQLQQLQADCHQRKDRDAETVSVEKSAEPAAKADKGKGKGKDKKGKAQTSGTTTPEKKTKLKRRDEIEPPTFIGDEPEDGPQQYILMMGFHQPQLIRALDAIDVPVENIIMLCEDKRETLKSPVSEQNLEQEPAEEVEDKRQKVDEETEPPALMAARARRLEDFWLGLESVLENKSPDSRLNDVVQLSYTVPSFRSSTDISDSELQNGTRIFDGIAQLIYKCVRWRQQHQLYREKLRLINIPVVNVQEEAQVEASRRPPVSARSKKKPVPQEPTPDEGKTSPADNVDMQHYNNLLDRVPDDICSVPLILHCVVEQVVLTLAASTPNTGAEPSEPSGGQGLDPQLLGVMLQNFLPLAQSAEQRGHLITSLLSVARSEDDAKNVKEMLEGGEEKSEQPVIIRHHDKRSLCLRNVKASPDFNPLQVEMSMMHLSPVWQLIHSPSQQRSGPSCWNVVKQQLFHHCSDDVVSWMEVQRLFHLSVFESLPLAERDLDKLLDQDSGLLQSPDDAGQGKSRTIIPWDDPLSFAREQLRRRHAEAQTFLPSDPDSTQNANTESCRLNLSDIQLFRHRSLSDWHYTEHHNPNIFLQILHTVSEDYSRLDTFRGTQNDLLYIFCHNPMGPDRQRRESWDAAVHTDVRFRKYLQYVVDDIADWLREEELKSELAGSEELAREEKAAAAVEEQKEQQKEEQENLEPIIRKDSLKAWKLAQEQNQDELNKKGKKGKKEEEVAKSKEKEPPQKEEEKKKVKASPVESVAPVAPPVEESSAMQPAVESPDRFTGYRTNGMLIRVSGCLQSLYPSDGGLIDVEAVNYVEGLSMIKVSLKKDGHYLCTHVSRATVEAVGPEQLQEAEGGGTARLKRGSFTALLDNGVRLSHSVYGPTGGCTVKPQDVDGDAPATSRQDSGQTGSAGSGSQDSPKSRERPVFRSLNLTVPSGLLLQFLQEDTPDWGVMVRQSFPLRGRGNGGLLLDPSLSTELSRTISSDGAVVRHLRDGSIQVLFADGSVSSSRDCGPVWVPQDQVQKETQQSPGSAEDEDGRGVWVTTTPSGARIHTVGTTHTLIPITPLLMYKATDPITQEVMLNREDRVVSVQQPDGSLTIDHTDGTRITTHVQGTLMSALVSMPRHATSHMSGRSLGTNGEEERGVEKERGGPAREKVVMVEKEGCATVVLYPQRQVMHVFLADGTALSATNSGVYEVFPSSGGVLNIQSNGKCVYSSQPPVNPRVVGGAAASPPGVYTMSHAEKVACDVTDPDGNHFQVMEDGQVSVKTIASPVRTVKQSEEDESQEERKDQGHFPRLFLLYADGSGTEFLSSRTVENFLDQAYSDPSVAVLREPLPDAQDEVAVTVQKPSHQSAWTQWLLWKQSPNITPPNLRNRSWQDFPGTEERTLGPPFGSDMGRGLTLKTRSGASAPQRPPVRSCPDLLEMRELYQHRQMGRQLKDLVDTRLKEYLESVMERERWSEQMKVKDPRSQEENLQASSLLNLVLSFAEDDSGGLDFDRRSSDVVELINTQVEAAVDVLLGSSSSKSFTGAKRSKWRERLIQHRQEMLAAGAQRLALSSNSVVPYFHPENSPLFGTLMQKQSAVAGSRPVDPPAATESDSAVVVAVEGPDLKQAVQTGTPRPLNPTPSQSASHTDNDSPVEERPTNPTPQSAGESPLVVALEQCKSVQMDLPRRNKVRLPSCILSSKPPNVPNQQFLSVEEPVRRRCRTISLANPDAVVRGFQLAPPSVAFGTLQEGTTATVVVRMRNVGVDTCRFHVKQPPVASGLRVLYNPGPVPAGLHADLQVQLFTLSATQVGEEEPRKRIVQDIPIHTEFQPILPQWSYNAWLGKDHKDNRRSFRSRPLATSTSGGQRGTKGSQNTQGSLQETESI